MKIFKLAVVVVLCSFTVTADNLQMLATEDILPCVETAGRRVDCLHKHLGGTEQNLPGWRNYSGNLQTSAQHVVIFV